MKKQPNSEEIKINISKCKLINLLTCICYKQNASVNNLFSKKHNRHKVIFRKQLQQHLEGTIFPGVITLVSSAPTCLLLSDFDQINADVLFRRVNLPIPSNFHPSDSVSIPCFNMNGSEWGLKISTACCDPKMAPASNIDMTLKC